VREQQERAVREREDGVAEELALGRIRAVLRRRARGLVDREKVRAHAFGERGAVLIRARVREPGRERHADGARPRAGVVELVGVDEVRGERGGVRERLVEERERGRVRAVGRARGDVEELGREEREERGERGGLLGGEVARRRGRCGGGGAGFE
jgi:hypothetical protein